MSERREHREVNILALIDTENRRIGSRKRSILVNILSLIDEEHIYVSRVGKDLVSILALIDEENRRIESWKRSSEYSVFDRCGEHIRIKSRKRSI